jgi:membrane dipeptidase
MMRFFDAHCDTVMRAFDSDYDFVAGHGGAHLDLPRLLATGSCVQLFAVFNSQRRDPERDLRAYVEEALAVLWSWVAAADGLMKMALNRRDIQAACRGDRVYGLLGLEGADCLGDQAGELKHLFGAGVRNVILAWDDNAFSGTVMGNRGPLTAEGARLVELCEAMGAMVDVSHLSDTAFWQVHDISRRPFVASHSNCRTLCPSPRNLTDSMIRALANVGGVMGINLSADFLDPQYWTAWNAIDVPARKALAAATGQDKERLKQERLTQLRTIPLPPASWVIRHVLHAVRVGGEDCVGLGGDLDGIEFMPTGITGIESYPAIADALSSAGLSESQIKKICWQNMARVYEEVLPE